MSAGGPPLSVASARSLLLTLLGEFVYPSTAPVWTQTLLQGLAAVGIAEKAARQALARAAAGGWIRGGKEGRQAWWALDDAGLRLVAEGSEHVRARRRAAREWAGTWLLLHVTLPESRRADRHRLYRTLQWQGFGSPTPALWISPFLDRAEIVREKLQRLDLESDTLAFSASSLPFGVAETEVVRRAWDIEAVAAYYRSIDATFRAKRPRSDEATFVAHVQIVNAIQRLPAVDPGLPTALLPRTWEGSQVSDRLEHLRSSWREAAHRYWRALAASGASASG